jgi:sec-independent protein translocase protein TatA
MPLLAGLGPLGVPELLIIAFIVVLVFGVGRLPEVGGAVGKGIREFRKATKDDEAAPPSDASSTAPDVTATGAATAAAPTPASASPAADTIFCSECGGRNVRSAKFCAECGKPIATPVS